MFVFLINVIGFILMNIILAYILKECILSVLPISISALTIILFILCLIRHLSWIDYFFILATAAIVILAYCLRRKVDWLKLKAIILDLNNVVIFGILIFIYIIAWNRIGSDYDELGVWALEVKTMFYTNGISMPNMHTSVGYANYIPGQMLIEWWFCHLFPSQFNDGLMFFGYYSIYYFTISPLFIYRDAQNKWISFARNLIMIPILFVLPSSFSIHEYSMLSVELLMSAIFVCIIYSLFDAQPHTKAYIRIQWIALSVMLVMLKKDAILFLILAHFTAFLLIYIDHKNAKSEQNISNTPILRVREHLNYNTLTLGLILPSVIVLVWQMAVRYYHRYGKFSTHSILGSLKDILRNISSGSIHLESDQIQYIRSFRETILFQPLHWNKTNFFDLTVISCIILIVFVLYLIYKNKLFRNGKQEYLTINCIAVGSIILFLLILLFMYVYIFREAQHFESANMIKSLSRYSEPLFLGWSVTGLLVCLNSKKPKLGIIVLALFLLCPSYTHIYNYFSTLESNSEKTREEYAQGREAYSVFFQETEDVFGISGQGRILVVNGDKEKSLNIRQFQYLSSPRSIYWIDYDNTDNFEEVIYNKITENVCGFVYFEQVPEDIVQSFVDEYNLKPLGNYLYEYYE